MLSNEQRNKIKDSNIEIKIEYLEYILEPVIETIIERLRENELVKSPMLTIEDIARKFQVTKATVHNWMKRGSIAGQKFGKNRYFTEEEVKRSMAKFGFSKHWQTEIDD